MNKDSEEYKTPEEKTKDLLKDIETTLSQDKSDITWQQLTEAWRVNKKDLNDSKTRRH
jgi:hypothetical protein